MREQVGLNQREVEEEIIMKAVGDPNWLNIVDGKDFEFYLDTLSKYLNPWDWMKLT